MNTGLNLHFLSFLGACLNVTIIQPAIVTAALGRDVTLPCYLTLSNNDPITAVLYWVYENDDNSKLWKPSGKYQGRVKMLDQNSSSLNKSIIFQNVQWVDKGKYLCKVSLTSHKKRARGTETELLVYDGITCGLNNNQLQCKVKVTKHPGFDLSISHNDHVLHSTAVPTITSSLYSTLSQTISLRGDGTYKCDLNFKGTIVTTRTFGRLRGLFEGNDTISQNVSLSGPPDPEEYPEPWHLYGGLIMVQLLFFLALLTAMLKHTC